MTYRSRMSFSMSPFGLEQLELFALELGNIAEFDFVYALASGNINQSAPNFVKIHNDHKILGEFDYGPDWTQTTRVAVFDLVCSVTESTCLYDANLKIFV